MPSVHTSHEICICIFVIPPETFFESLYQNLLGAWERMRDTETGLPGRVTQGANCNLPGIRDRTAKNGAMAPGVSGEQANLAHLILNACQCEMQWQKVRHPRHRSDCRRAGRRNLS